MGRGGGGGGGHGGGGGRGGHGGGGWGRGGGGRGGGGYASGGSRGRGRGSGKVAGSGSKNGRMRKVGRNVQGMKNSGNRGISREHRKEASDMINKLNDIRQKYGNIKGPHGEARRARQGRMRGRIGGNLDHLDLLMVGVEEICARIAAAAVLAAIAQAYGMCVNEGQLAIIDDQVPNIEACEGAIAEGANVSLEFPHPEAVSETNDAVNNILNAAADQCAQLRALAEEWEQAIEDNDGKGKIDYDWYGMD